MNDRHSSRRKIEGLPAGRQEGLRGRGGLGGSGENFMFVDHRISKHHAKNINNK